MSNALFARTTPVNPPIVNKKRKPRTHIIEDVNCKGVPCNLASQEKILMPVGIAMIMVAEVK